MSYLSNALVACETLQGRLEDYWQTTDAMGADENMPLAEFLANPANRRNIQTAILPGQGKKKVVRVTYFQRLTEDTVAEDGDNPVCEASDKYGNLSTDYEMPDTNLVSSELVDTDDLTNFCEENGSYFLSRLAAHLDVIERKVATQWAEEAVLLAGKWGALGQTNSLFPSGTAAGSINSSDEYVWTTRYSDGKINPESWWDLRFALNKIGYGGNVALIGGSTAFKYFGATQVGCCADSGIDVANAMNSYGYGVAYDKRLASALASENKLMAFVPGSILPLVYTKNQWKDGVPPLITNGATFIHTTVFTRRLGIPVDVTINHPCGTEISMGVAVSTKLIGLPTDQFATNDPYFGKNGINKIVITNP